MPKPVKPKKKAPKRVMKLSEEQYIHRLLQDKKISGNHKIELFRRLCEIRAERERAKSMNNGAANRSDKLSKLLQKDTVSVNAEYTLIADCESNQ